MVFACGKADEAKPETKPAPTVTKQAFRDAMGAIAAADTLEQATAIASERLGAPRANITWYFQDAESCLELVLAPDGKSFKASGGEWYKATEAPDYQACVGRASK